MTETYERVNVFYVQGDGSDYHAEAWADEDTAEPDHYYADDVTLGDIPLTGSGAELVAPDGHDLGVEESDDELAISLE